jgi:hypothetical protein
MEGTMRNIKYIATQYNRIREELEQLKKKGIKLDPQKGVGAFELIGNKYGYKKSWVRKIYYYSPF